MPFPNTLPNTIHTILPYNNERFMQKIMSTTSQCRHNVKCLELRITGSFTIELEHPFNKSRTDKFKSKFAKSF